MRPYADRMQELMIGTARAASSFKNLALLQRREGEEGRVCSSSRATVGSPGRFNGQVLRRRVRVRAN